MSVSAPLEYGSLLGKGRVDGPPVECLVGDEDFLVSLHAMIAINMTVSNTAPLMPAISGIFFEISK